MTNKSIQEERIRSYFLDSAKQILMSEGISALSVRNVAKQAGYSYATLYNYFNGLPDLISHCIADFQKDCGDFISAKTNQTNPPKQQIKIICRAYIDYLVQYPSLFTLFYLEPLSVHGVHKSASLFLDDLCADVFSDWIKSRDLNPEQAEIIKNRLRNTLTGALLLYLIGNFPADYSVFIHEIEDQLNWVFEF